MVKGCALPVLIASSVHMSEQRSLKPENSTMKKAISTVLLLSVRYRAYAHGDLFGEHCRRRDANSESISIRNFSLDRVCACAGERTDKRGFLVLRK